MRIISRRRHRSRTSLLMGSILISWHRLTGPLNEGLIYRFGKLVMDQLIDFIYYVVLIAIVCLLVPIGWIKRMVKSEVFRPKLIAILTVIFVVFTLAVLNARAAGCEWCPSYPCYGSGSCSSGCYCLIPSGELEGTCYSIGQR